MVFYTPGPAVAQVNETGLLALAAYTLVKSEGVTNGQVVCCRVSTDLLELADIIHIAFYRRLQGPETGNFLPAHKSIPVPWGAQSHLCRLVA